MLACVRQVSVVQGEGREKKRRKEGRKGKRWRMQQTRQDEMKGEIYWGSIAWFCVYLSLSVKTEREGFYSKMPVAGSTYKYATMQAEIRGTEKRKIEKRDKTILPATDCVARIGTKR